MKTTTHHPGGGAADTGAASTIKTPVTPALPALAATGGDCEGWRGGPTARRLAIRENVIDPSSTCMQPTYYFSPHIDPRALEAELTLAFRGRRDRLFPPSAGQDRMRVMRRFGYRGILWDTLIRFPETGGPAS